MPVGCKPATICSAARDQLFAVATPTSPSRAVAYNDS